MNIVDRIISPNIWDEITELGGINLSTGQNTITNATIRSKNYIECEPSKSYQFTMPNSLKPTGIYVYWYNTNKNFIKPNLANTANGLIKNSPSNARFFRIVITNEYGTTYNHDICINESNPSINGKYFPYVMYKRYDIVDLIHTHNLWNKTVKYNQLFNKNNFATSKTENGITFTNNGDGTITVSGTATANVTYNLDTCYFDGTGKKYLLFGAPSTSTDNNYFLYDSFNGNKASANGVISAFRSSAGYISFVIRVNSGTIISNSVIFEPKFICLTDWFGSNDLIPQALLDDPSTFDEYWDGELPYDTGTDVLPNNSIKRLKIGG